MKRDDKPAVIGLGHQAQLALALFQEYEADDRGVKDAPESLGYHRNDAFIEIVDLSLAGRRLIDVAYFLVAEDVESRSIYRYDYGLFRWLMGTTSRNRIHFEKAIRDAQKAAIKVKEIDHNDESKDRWGAIPLMGPAFIANGEVVFELTERMQRIIKKPESSHFLSLRHVFGSLYSRVLYDRLLPYAAAGVTPFFELPQLREWLDCTAKTYDEFKYLRAKILEPAMAEIAEVTKLVIRFVPGRMKGSRKISSIRFIIEGKVQEDTTKTDLHVLKNFYEILRREFGLNSDQLNEIATNRATLTDQRIQDAIEYTRHNIEAGVVKKANAYFMKALREGYVLAEADKRIQQRALELEEEKKSTQVKQAQVITTAMVAEETRARTRDEALIELAYQGYAALKEDTQVELLAAYGKSLPGSMLLKRLGIPAEGLRFEKVQQVPDLRFGFGQHLNHYFNPPTRRVA